MKLKKNLFLFYLVFCTLFAVGAFVFDDVNNSLMASASFPDTLNVDSMIDSYLLDGTVGERLGLLIGSLTEISTWIFVLGAFAGAYAVLWFFKDGNIADTMKVGLFTVIFMFAFFLFGLNVFELNIWLKTPNFMIGMLNFLILGKIFALIAVKYDI